jgi:hypothetical protein
MPFEAAISWRAISRLTKSCDASYHRRAQGSEIECAAMNQADESAMLALNNQHREET